MLRSLFTGTSRNHFLALKQVFPSFSVTNGENSEKAQKKPQNMHKKIPAIRCNSLSLVDTPTLVDSWRKCCNEVTNSAHFLTMVLKTAKIAN